jgi:hypothetical protein
MTIESIGIELQQLLNVVGRMISNNASLLNDEIYIGCVNKEYKQIDKYIKEKWTEIGFKFAKAHTNRFLNIEKMRPLKSIKNKNIEICMKSNKKTLKNILNFELPHKKIIVRCFCSDNIHIERLIKYKHIAITITFEEKGGPLTIEDVIVGAKIFLCKGEDNCEYYVDEINLEIIEDTPEKLEIVVSFNSST